MTKLDNWWMRTFQRLLDAEQHDGASPGRLINRWLVLDLHSVPIDKRPRWTVGFSLPETILHFLDDADIRAKDAAYARQQWAVAREWLNG